MQLVEKHVIDRDDPRYRAIDAAAFASKNIYNATLYIVRQIFIGEGEYLNYNTMDKIMQKHEAYRGLPTKVAQMVVKQVHEAWVSFFEACKEYREHPEKFTGRPKLPGYKDKVNGRNLLTYNMQAVSRGKKTLDRGIISPSQLSTLIIGKNDGWKNGTEKGKRNNQNFCFIPHARFIEMLKYKASLVGIKVVLTEESYTSKASFLDQDWMPVYDPKNTEKYKFSGRRVECGLYRAKDGRLINADVNGSLNIMRKVAPKAFESRVVEDGKARFSHALVVHPVRLVITPSRNQKGKS